jgi:homoserine dehydrogenase
MGIGVVGAGTFNVLKRNQEEIQRRAGRGIEITMVADLDVARAQSIVGAGVQVVSDARAVIANPDIDIVIELIGGYGIAKTLVLEAIAAGKHVVTANKALLAVHGTEIFAAASARGVMVAFEAAVAGGIPIIKALREGLTANRIQWIAGIINGTTNFILSEMRDKGLDFAVVLKEAQRLGYAEADPTFDIEGVDAAHKVTLMSAIAFGIPVQFDKAYVEGITKLGAADIKYAEQLGYRIKLLGITKRRDADAAKGTAAGIELRVHPSLIPAKRLIANVEGAMNAVVVNGDAVGNTLYYGKGAGSEPTASAVIADLVDITRLHTADPLNRVPHLAFQPGSMSDLPVLPMGDVVTSYYLRLRVADEAGVLAKVTGILAAADISIDAVLQREADEVGGEGDVPEGTRGMPQTDVIILTHDCQEARMNLAMALMQSLPTVLQPIVRIRKEELA